MKTRSRKVALRPSKEATTVENPTTKTFSADVERPPHIFVLPKHISPAARIITLPDCATQNRGRYLVCPEHGFYEFTKVAGPKRTPRSWLLASDPRASKDRQSLGVDEKLRPDQTDRSKESEGADHVPQDTGYVLRHPDLFVATPVDPLFILLPTLMGSNDSPGQEFLAASDYMVALVETAPHLQSILQPHAPGRLERILEARIDAVCDCMDLGDDKMYALSLSKLVRVLVSKAKQTVGRGLPPSMEARFIKQSLDIPDLGIKREESSVSAVTEGLADVIDNDTASKRESRGSDLPSNGLASSDTAIAATTSCSEESQPTPKEVVDLLRLRTVFDFLVASYTPPKLHGRIHALLRDQKCSQLDLSALEKQMAHVESLRRQAQALRTLSDNVSRKRSATEDEEATEKAEAKRRKKEEEESKKRNTSQGVKQLMKADTSGMKKLSAFFSKAPIKK